VVDVLHGQEIADPYRWLEDVTAESTVTWSAAQDALFHAVRDTWPGRTHLQRRLTELLGTGTVTVPVWRGGRPFYLRREPGQEHAVLLTQDADGTERVLLDPMTIDPGGTTTLDSWQPTKEGHRIAYQLSEGGTEESVLRVMDVETGTVIEGPIDRVRYSPVSWLLGGDAFYYVRRLPASLVPEGEEQFHRRIYLHHLGTDPDDDTEIFGEGLDPTNYYDASVSRDGRWLQVVAAAGTAPRNDLWVADLEQGDPAAPELVPVQVGVDATLSLQFGRDGRVYAYSDRDAPRGRLLVTTPGDWDVETWAALVPERDDAVLEGWAVLDGDEMTVLELLVVWTEHAVGRITRHALADGRQVGEVPLPGVGTVAGLTERPEGGHEAWFGYTDHTTPVTIERFDARSGETTRWASPPGSIDVPAVRAEQVEYNSADGTTVRMFVVSREGDHGPRPTILYGYGGFGIGLTPAFSATILAWVEAGGCYAVANLRGGSEEGEDWHRAGMRENKQNVFDDFIAAAQWLIDHGVTTSAQLVISGGSNGGLLVGAALTQHPDLYAGVICAAPLLDMVRYEKHGLGPTWSDEFGTAEDPQELSWLMSYSPYHHVQPGTAYPAVLFTVFEGDTRVDPLHARKMAAALQFSTSSHRPVLVRREAEVGHSGRSVSRTVDLSADTLAFAAAVTGLQLPQ
jgi:prolyl oligopeptidase